MLVRDERLLMPKNKLTVKALSYGKFVTFWIFVGVISPGVLWGSRGLGATRVTHAGTSRVGAFHATRHAFCPLELSAGLRIT